MWQRFLLVIPLAILGVVLCAFQAVAGLEAAFCNGTQDAGGNSSPAQPPSAPQAQTPPTGSETKKAKRVWTNDDLGNSAGTAPSSADTGKPATKSISAKPPNTQYAASVRKQIEALQKRLIDTDQQLVDLKKFKDGESVGGNMQLHKRYNTVPIDQQIADLQEKKKRIQAQLDALFDDARKKGIDPGQLR
jgi:hypothetical protein